MPSRECRSISRPPKVAVHSVKSVRRQVSKTILRGPRRTFHIIVDSDSRAKYQRGVRTLAERDLGLATSSACCGATNIPAKPRRRTGFTVRNAESCDCQPKYGQHVAKNLPTKSSRSLSSRWHGCMAVPAAGTQHDRRSALDSAEATSSVQYILLKSYTGGDVSDTYGARMRFATLRLVHQAAPL